MACPSTDLASRVTERIGSGSWVSFVGYVRHAPTIAGMVAGQQLTGLFEGRATGTVCLDFESVICLHAGEVGKVVALWKRLKDDGRRLVLCNAHPLICEVFSITRLDTLMAVRKCKTGL